MRFVFAIIGALVFTLGFWIGQQVWPVEEYTLNGILFTALVGYFVGFVMGWTRREGSK